MLVYFLRPESLLVILKVRVNRVVPSRHSEKRCFSYKRHSVVKNRHPEYVKLGYCVRFGEIKILVSLKCLGADFIIAPRD